MSKKVQVPLMLQLMKQAGMKKVTVEFIRTVFSKGAEYIDDVDISGLYPELPVDKQLGNYEYVEPPVLKKIWDVNRTVLTSSHVRVPDKHTDKIYQYTKQEVDLRTKGSVPFVTIVGPIHTLQELPLDEVVPAFRFWVPQDVSSGADEGRTVDGLTASGGNYRTRICEKLELPSLDDFVAMVKRASELSPEEVWG